MMTEEELKLYGFRWLTETELALLNGKTITVRPDGYLRSREDRAPDDRSRKCLRLYEVRTEGEVGIQELDELEIEKLIGNEPSEPTGQQPPADR